MEKSQIILKNDFITAAFKTKGAELTSLKTIDGTEFIWQADPNYWPWHSPLLFPIVGGLNNGSFFHNFKRIPMERHGFARNSEFEVSIKEDDRVVFVLQSNDALFENYPFIFTLEVEYRLLGNELTVTYRVYNGSIEKMYFNIGAHPAFNCPLDNNSTFEYYYLEFEQPETLSRQMLKNGLFNGDTKPALKNSSILALNHELFNDDAIIFFETKSKKITLKNRKGGKSISVLFPKFKQLGLWQKPGAPFICIEPWNGHADFDNSTGVLKDKKNIIALEPKAIYSCSYSIQIHE